MAESDSHYVVSRDFQGPLYIGRDPHSPEASPDSPWFITRDKGKVHDIGNRDDAKQIANELNRKAIKEIFGLTDPDKRLWQVVGEIE